MYRYVARTTLDATGPGSDGGISPTVRMQYREGIGRPWLAADRHEHSTATGQRLENSGVVRLEPDTPHGAGKPQLPQIVGAALQRFEQRSMPQDRTDRGQ